MLTPINVFYRTHIGSNKIKTINPHETAVTGSTFSFENDRTNLKGIRN